MLLDEKIQTVEQVRHLRRRRGTVDVDVYKRQVNICNALRTSQLFNTPNMSRSAYVAKVKTENCVACGRCVEYCPAGAVKLGQKLCTQNAVSYTHLDVYKRQ